MPKLISYGKLYKETANNKTQVWWGELLDSKFRTATGKVDGAIVYSSWTECFPKNIGKVNETTANQQAILELESLYKKKKTIGNYKESISKTSDTRSMLPMLAKEYGDYTSRIESIFSNNDYVYVQPKLDGIRCIASKDGLFSRNGKEIVATPHILKALGSFFKKMPNIIFDGELYNHGLKENFSEIVSLVRKLNVSNKDLEQSKKYIQYHIYDCFGDGVGNLRFSERNYIINNLFLRNTDNLVFVETFKCKDKDHIDELHAYYTGLGYEGSMIRIEGPYEHKRSNLLLKRKDFMDAEFRILSMTEGIGNRAGTVGFITYDLGDGSGRTFDSNMRGSFEYMEKVLKEKKKYIGGTGTVRYFGYGSNGRPRFPVTTALFEGDRNL